MTKIATTTLICLIALSAAGCAVEVPMSAFRVAPPDATLKDDARDAAPGHQDLKHVTVD